MYEGAEQRAEEFRKVHLRIFAEDSELWVSQQVRINEGTCEIAADDVCQPTRVKFAGDGSDMVKIAPSERPHENYVRLRVVPLTRGIYSEVVLQEGTDFREIRGDHEPAWSVSMPYRPRDTCCYHACPRSQLDSTKSLEQVIHKGRVKFMYVAIGRVNVGTKCIRSFPIQCAFRGRVGLSLEGKGDEVFTRPCLRYRIWRLLLVVPLRRMYLRRHLPKDVRVLDL
jgi:hypothetical protein